MHNSISPFIRGLLKGQVLAVFICVAALLAPEIARAGGWYFAGPAGGSSTLTDIKKGRRVTVIVNYAPPSDSDEASAAEGELYAIGATVTIEGAPAPITVNATNPKVTVKFIATKNAPGVTFAMQLAGSGSVGNDGDDGGATIVWRGTEKDTGEPPCDGKCGDPINALTGNSFQREVDYVGAGEFPLTFVRFYNSMSGDTPTEIGNGWSHSYGHTRAQYTLEGFVHFGMNRAEGTKYLETPYGPDADSPVVGQSIAGCVNCFLNKKTNVIESYDPSTGKLVAMYDLKGNSQTLAYDGAARLVSVTHSNGRSLRFSYDASNRIQTMTDPNGAVYTYGYGANNNLVSVQHPDTATRQYVYGNATYPNAMTALVDELGNSFATWTYDANGYAITSSVGGGLIVENASSPDPNSDIHTITDGAGTTRTLAALEINGKLLVTSANIAGASGGSTSSGSLFTSATNPAVRTNKNGSIDCYGYNAVDQETRVIFNGNISGGSCSAGGGSAVRSAAWHPAIYQRTVVAEPSRMAYIVYHGQPDPTNGNAVADCMTPADPTFAGYMNIVCKTVVYATSDSTGGYGLYTGTIKSGVAPKVAAFTYDPSGRLLTSTDSLGNVTTYAYYADTTADHTVGDLQSITNALQQVATFDRYDGNGRVLQTTNPNGLVQTLTYDWRGDVLTRTVGALTTTYVYDAAGQLKSTQQADGSKTLNAYDLAHRLQKVTDPAGNTTNYGYDPVSNVSSVTLKDSAGNTVQTKQYVYDYMNNIVKSVGGAQ
jgi:YD repeat-containing protein